MRPCAPRASWATPSWAPRFRRHVAPRVVVAPAVAVAVVAVDGALARWWRRLLRDASADARPAAASRPCRRDFAQKGGQRPRRPTGPSPSPPTATSAPVAVVVPPVLVEAPPVAAAPFEVFSACRLAASCFALTRSGASSLRRPCERRPNTLQTKARPRRAPAWPDPKRVARFRRYEVEPHTPERIRRDTHLVPARRHAHEGDFILKSFHEGRQGVPLSKLSGRSG